jgi:Uma2 family endonuclease
MADVGFFFKRRVELLGGKIIDMAAQHDLHTGCVELAKRACEKTFGSSYWVRVQFPLHLDRVSGPEPDIAVVPGGPRDYMGKGHPKSALLVIEVSDTTLKYDRQSKGPRYARAQYPDYWIVNLIDRCVEVYRKPMADPSARFGWRYSQVMVLRGEEQIAPLSAGGAAIAAADLLP